MRTRRERIAPDTPASRDGSRLSTSPRLITPIPGPKSLALAGKLRQVESPNVTYTSDRFPVFWESAHGCAVTDVDGNVFLDMTAAFGVSSVGHAHSDVVAAVQAQAGKLLHGMGDVHPAAIKVALCERIASRVPIPNAQVILSQNGSDAVESALKTAVLATGKPGVIAFDGGYHGLSYGALNATSRPDFRAPFLSQMGRFISHLPFGCPPEMIDDQMAAGEIGAVLVEPIQGRGGINVPPPGWLADVHRVCGRHGALLILDEIFTGWGRTGNWFACEYEKVIPDILCIGKAMGGGLPISACVAAKATMAAWPVSRARRSIQARFLAIPWPALRASRRLMFLSGKSFPRALFISGPTLNASFVRCKTGILKRSVKFVAVASCSVSSSTLRIA